MCQMMQTDEYLPEKEIDSASVLERLYKFRTADAEREV